MYRFSFGVSLTHYVSSVLSYLVNFGAGFLCFFLDTGILQKVIFSAIFQTAALISENICVTISSLLYSGTLTGYEYDISMNLMSKIILLIFTILLSFMKKDRPKHPKEYSVLMLFTPILTVCLLALMPLNRDYINSHISFKLISRRLLLGSMTRLHSSLSIVISIPPPLSGKTAVLILHYTYLFTTASSNSIPFLIRFKDSSLPITSIISVAPAGVICFPDTAVLTGQSA